MRSLLRAVRECPSLLVFLDYDGTLVPIRARPEMARLHPRRRTVLTEVARRHPTAVPLYCGDDRTDEDAFQALAGRGLTVLAGPQRKSAARFRLSDVEAVWRFLRALLLI